MPIPLKANAKKILLCFLAGFLLLLNCATQAQTIVEYTIPTASSQPWGITAGPDGNLWFVERSSNKVGKVTTTGDFTEYSIPTLTSDPRDITVGSDSNLWFVEQTSNKVGKVTTTGFFTEYSIPTPSSTPRGITAGPDGNLWFTEFGSNKIGKVTPSGSFAEYTIPTTSSGPLFITVGPDGNLWFTENNSNKIAKVTPAGGFTEYLVPTSSSDLRGITAGPDGNLWFTETIGNKIGKITIGGSITEYVIPTSGSQPYRIIAGVDGNLWFTEFGTNKIGKITTSGIFTEYSIPTIGSKPHSIITGYDGNLWFTEADLSANKIGVLYLPYSETPSVGTGSNTGLISPNSTQVVNGTQSANFTLTAMPPYTNINVTGTCGGTLHGNVFVTSPVPPTHNCTVIANFYRPNTAPVITSGNNATFIAGQSGNFTVTDTGYPEPALSETGALPPGLSFNASTGIISGATNTTGTYPIQFTSNNAAGTAIQNFTLTVLKTLQSITVASPVTNPAPNQKIALTVTAHYSDGSQQDVTSLIQKISSNNMASVLPAPLSPDANRAQVYTRDSGTATLTVTLGNVTGSLVMNVVAIEPYLKSIHLSSPSNTVATCQHLPLTATGIYSDGSTQDITSNITFWRTTNSSVGAIGQTGEVVGRMPGNFMVTGSLYTRLATLNLNVTASTLDFAKSKAKNKATTPTDTCLPGSATVPLITELSPNAGPLLDAANSPVITIHGTDFMPDATVKIGESGSPIQCQPNDSTTACTYIDNGTLQLRMPVMNTPGAVSISVTNPDETESVPITERANVYTVVSLTGIKTFVEEQSNLEGSEGANGPTLGGTGFALTGIFPAKGTPIEVDFDGTPADLATVNSTSRITANTPAHEVGTVEVSLYAKNKDETKTLLGTLPHAYQYRPQRCTLGSGQIESIDQCVTELKACVFVQAAPTTEKRIQVTSHLVTNSTLTGGMPQCVDALPKFDEIVIPTEGSYPNLLCTTSTSPLVANRTATPSAACAATASNGSGKVPNLTMVDLAYRDATGQSNTEEHALVVPLTWEDRVSLIAANGESYKGMGSMQLAQSGYSPQTSSTGFCLLTPDVAQHLPLPVAGQANYCLNAGLYSTLGTSPWNLQTIADKSTFMVVDGESELV